MMSQLTFAAVVVAGVDEPGDALGGALARADADALPDGDADAPSADWSILVVLPPDTAMMMPRVRPSAIGMPRGTARRAARLFRVRRRHADRCPVRIRSTSFSYDLEGTLDPRRVADQAK